jgi:hypothetical protein
MLVQKFFSHLLSARQKDDVINETGGCRKFLQLVIDREISDQ